MNKFLVIGGTEKAATTSLYSLLVKTNEFSIGERKELDYLRCKDVSIEEYVGLFKDRDEKIMLDASPGYLSESDIVSKNINRMGMKRATYIFILRSPIRKIKSSFLFHKSRLDIPNDMSFDEYISACFDQNYADIRVNKWCLDVPSHTLYSKKLSLFDGVIDRESLYVFEFNDFVTNMIERTNEVLKSLGTNRLVTKEDLQKPSNITRSYKNRWVQYFALKINDKFGMFFIKNKVIKDYLIKIYGLLNQKENEEVSLRESNLEILINYYRNDIESLVSTGYISRDIGNKWLEDFNEIKVYR